MNKYEKALDTLRADFEEFAAKPKDVGRFFRHSEADECLQELVDKEKPMKPEIIKQSYVNLNLDFEYIYFHKCAVCGNDIHFYDNYCSKCGQKIDWSENDNEEKSME